MRALFILFSLILLSGFVGGICDLIMKLPIVLQFGIMISIMIVMFKLMVKVIRKTI